MVGRLPCKQEVAGSIPVRSTDVNLNQVGIVRNECFPRLVISVTSVKVAGSTPETLNARGEDVRRADLVSGDADLGEARTKRACQSAVRLGAGLDNEAMWPRIN